MAVYGTVRPVGKRGLRLRGKVGHLMAFFSPFCGLIGAWARLLSGGGDTIIFAESRIQRASKGSKPCGNGHMPFTPLLIWLLCR